MAELDLDGRGITGLGRLLEAPAKDREAFAVVAAVSLRHNAIESLGHGALLAFPALSRLVIAGNRLGSLRGGLPPTLRSVDASDNLIGTLAGLEGCPLLEHVDVSNNRLTSLVGLPALSLAGESQRGAAKLTLIARNNELQALRPAVDSVGPALVHLDVTGNAVSSLRQLSALADCPLLRELLVAGNPAAERDQAATVLRAVLPLCRVDVAPPPEPGPAPVAAPPDPPAPTQLLDDFRRSLGDRHQVPVQVPDQVSVHAQSAPPPEHALQPVLQHPPVQLSAAVSATRGLREAQLLLVAERDENAQLRRRLAASERDVRALSHTTKKLRAEVAEAGRRGSETTAQLSRAKRRAEVDGLRVRRLERDLGAALADRDVDSADPSLSQPSVEPTPRGDRAALHRLEATVAAQAKCIDALTSENAALVDRLEEALSQYMALREESVSMSLENA